MAYGSVLPFGPQMTGMLNPAASLQGGFNLGMGMGMGRGSDGANISQEANQESQQAIMAVLMMVVEMLMETMSGGSSFGGSPFGGSPFGGGFSPLGGLPGSFPGGGGGTSSPTGGGGGGGSTSSGPITASGNPSQAVQIAQSHMGQGSGSFTFPNYTHAGGTGNDCADFVSACVADAGTFKKTGADANVGNFSSDLAKQGWKQTSNPQPGDVAIVNGSQHAELVCGPGGKCIGSNGGEVNQHVSNDTPSSWGSVVYWAPPGH